jgi:Transposase, Mutator family
LSSQKTKPKSEERDFSGTLTTQSPLAEATDRLAGLLPGEELEKALEGLAPEQITGPGGLLSQLAGRVIETALGAELTEHLGYPLGQAPPGGAGNHRNGSTEKTVQTELGPVPVRTPRGAGRGVVGKDLRNDLPRERVGLGIAGEISGERDAVFHSAHARAGPGGVVDGHGGAERRAALA